MRPAPAAAAPEEHAHRPPRPAVAAVVGLAAAAGLALSGWLATRPSAPDVQEDLVRWFNDPPQPIAALLALVNPLLRPVPLLVVALLLVGWVLVRCEPRRDRLTAFVGLAVALLSAEAIAQVSKRIAHQPRPLAELPGLDPHGYPTNPRGNAFPSAHTAVAVAIVGSLWPWMTVRQRLLGVAAALAVAANRIYIGAHWPVDIAGGAAAGLLAAAVSWLVTWWATRAPGDGGDVPA